MRRIALIFALLLFPLAFLPAQELTREWKAYDRLERKDRPKDQISKLHEIRTLALERRLPVDLYKSCLKEKGVYRRYHWKATDSLNLALTGIIESYGEPLLTYIWLGEDWEYALAHREELRAGNHPSLHNLVYVNYPAIKEDILDDFEWILWARIHKSHSTIPDSEEYRLLDELIGDRYPARPYLQYLTAMYSETPLEDLQALVEQYTDDPFRFIPEKKVLEERMHLMQMDENTPEADYRALYDDMEAFAKAEKATRGVNRRMNLSVDFLRTSLTSSLLSIGFQNDSIVMIGRNFGRGTLTFISDEYRKTVSFRNDDGPFYVLDRLKAPVPVLPEGSYMVTSDIYGTIASSYENHTLSLAVRREGEEFSVYVTDYQTGEPVPSATIRLINPLNHKKILEQDITMNGFTPLPAGFQKKIGKKSILLEARVGERRSPSVLVSREKDAPETPPATIHSRVLKERGAYQPGDTLKAKSILFEGDLRERVSTLPAGKDVQVKIINAEKKSLAVLDLKTNAFGSVAWEWPIPEGERNGLWTIDVLYKKKTLARSYFRVDEFVLPTFEVSFDPKVDPYLPDTTFVVKGKVESFSGHPANSISLEGRVTMNNRDVWNDEVSMESGGTFQIPLKLPNAGNYCLIIKAMDATGETREFKHNFTVSRNLSLKAALENPTSGEFSFRGAKYDNALLTDSIGRISWTIINGKEPVRLPVTYWLMDADGNTVLEGVSEQTLELNLSDCPDGLFFLRGTVEAGNSRAKVVRPILKTISELNGRVESVFLSGDTEIKDGEAIRARIGTGNGPLWAVTSLTSPDGSILESRKVHLEGSDSLSELVFTYDNSYPDAVRLEVFYFRGAGCVSHEAVYHRVRHDMDMSLTCSRFEDRTRPGAPFTLSLQTEPGTETAVAVFDRSLDAIAPNVWQQVEPLPTTFRTIWSQSRAGKITGERPSSAGDHTGPIWGVVIDYEGEPIIGASITVPGTTEYAMTDMDGSFSLDVRPGTMLEFSSIGYISGLAQAEYGMEIILEEDVECLEETQVIAFGSYVSSVSHRLAGLVAGVQIRGQSSRIRNSETHSSVIIPEGSFVEDMPEVSDEDFRDVFSEALAFEPFLYPAPDGKVDFTFQTSDKLSTYHVNVFAHDKTMRNASLRKDFVVTVPVQISVATPRYLYEEDKYILSASVSNISKDTLTGRLYLKVEMEDSAEERQPTYAQAAELTVPADGSASALFTLTAPPSFQPSFVNWWDDAKLNLRLVFDGEGFSDAVRFSVPVYRTEQPLTESHSAFAGEEAVDSLRRTFVNIPGEKAEVSFKTLREVAESGLEQWTAPDGPDALSLSAAFYAQAVLGRDTTGMLAPLMALRREDGGFAWTEGMDSSPVVTATLLERFATLRDKGISIPDMDQSVHYLDHSQFGNWMPMWCGGLSDEQYMDIRAMWTSVPFDLTGVDEKTVRRFRLREFRRFARSYLTPGRYDYANGWILDKARRVRTLKNLTASETGLALGKDWGEQLLTASRFEKSIEKDLKSLSQYAVRHPSGGLYYPNAVLPFRGLMSSEVYAHTLLSNLMEGSISEGVRLWLALQNETQSWTEDPAYVDALQAILSTPDSLLNRQIVTLTATKDIPFADIKASSNGMRIDRKFYLEQSDGVRTEIHPGDTLMVGEKLIAEYELWSAENRSFVRIDAFREACFLPADQLSGPVNLSMSPIRIDGLWTRIPQCYRDVRTDRTSWWLDVCPEENTKWEESFFVTQAGTFTAPVITVESLYAPQYRANATYNTPISTIIQ